MVELKKSLGLRVLGCRVLGFMMHQTNTYHTE